MNVQDKQSRTTDAEPRLPNPVEAIRARVSIIEACRHLGLSPFAMPDGSHEAWCRSCDDSSLVVVSTPGRFYCTGCSVRGDVIDLWCSVRKSSVCDAIVELTDIANDGLPERLPAGTVLITLPPPPPFGEGL